MASDPDYNWLCNEDLRKTILTQIFATENQMLSVEEVWYRNPQENIPSIAETMDNLLNRGFIEPVSIDSEVQEHVFYRGTVKAKAALVKDGRYQEMESYREKYRNMGRTERIMRIEAKRRQLS